MRIVTTGDKDALTSGTSFSPWNLWKIMPQLDQSVNEIRKQFCLQYLTSSYPALNFSISLKSHNALRSLGIYFLSPSIQAKQCHLSYAVLNATHDRTKYIRYWNAVVSDHVLPWYPDITVVWLWHCDVTAELSLGIFQEARSAVGNIKTESLSEIRSLRAPPDVIRDILEGVLMLMGIYDTSWVSMKR